MTTIQPDLVARHYRRMLEQRHADIAEGQQALEAMTTHIIGPELVAYLDLKLNYTLNGAERIMVGRYLDIPFRIEATDLHSSLCFVSEGPLRTPDSVATFSSRDQFVTILVCEAEAYRNADTLKAQS